MTLLSLRSICGINHLQRATKHWTIFDCLWFVVVTFSTVGYGDLTPRDRPTQTFVMFMIVISLVMLPFEVKIVVAFQLMRSQKSGS